MTDPGPWDEMADAEYAEWCAEFERDRMLEDAQDYLNELDSKEEFENVCTRKTDASAPEAASVIAQEVR